MYDVPHRFIRLASVTALMTVLVLAGCDSSNDETDAPDVFPAQAFTIETELFNQTPVPKQAVGLNFTAAALRVWPVSIILTASIAIPSALTNSALQAEPVFEDGSWIWAASASPNGVTAAYSLIGTRRDGGTDWSMRVTMQDPQTQTTLDDFELFTGRTTDNGLSGSWSLFYPSDSVAVNALNAEYAITSETEKRITFSIPDVAGTHGGDTIDYAENGDERTFTWDQQSASANHLVIWNDASSEGSITATNFRSGVTSCWDADLDDMPCPETTNVP